jgi:hypothetical protein
METIYHGQCEHLFCDDIESKNCLKRYFRIYDIEKNEIYRISVCNDFFRLKLRQEMIHLDEYDWRAKDYFVSKILEDILSEYIFIKNNPYYPNKSLRLIPFSKQIISIQICDRPNLYQNILLTDAINLSLKHQFTNSFNINRKRYGFYGNGVNVIKEHLKQYITLIDGVKKYKTIYDDLAKDIDKLYDYNWNQTELKITELLTKILNYKTK